MRKRNKKIAYDTAHARLEIPFFDRPVLTVARELIGMRLIRLLDGEPVGGIIIETEAYNGEEDLACHARAGRTARTEVMYGPPAHAYVYFNYGIHWLFNVVTGPGDFPSAVLVRAIHPTEGIETIAKNRAGQHPKNWCNGPAKICKALSIDRGLNGHPLCSPDSEIWIEAGETVPDKFIQAGPRIGIPNVPEPWRSKPWRFLARCPPKSLP